LLPLGGGVGLVDQALVGEVALEGIGKGHDALLQVEVLLHKHQYRLMPISSSTSDVERPVRHWSARVGLALYAWMAARQPVAILVKDHARRVPRSVRRSSYGLPQRHARAGT
jgi:hypothetical protein